MSLYFILNYHIILFVYLPITKPHNSSSTNNTHRNLDVVLSLRKYNFYCYKAIALLKLFIFLVYLIDQLIIYPVINFGLVVYTLSYLNIYNACSNRPLTDLRLTVTANYHCSIPIFQINIICLSMHLHKQTITTISIGYIHHPIC